MNVPSPRHNDVANEAALLDPVGGVSLRLRFVGPFEGQTVTWNATFKALCANRGHEESQPNYIDIGETTAEGITLTVGLNVSQIDLPTMRKTMMMIRQYKRLRRGRHEYGSP